MTTPKLISMLLIAWLPSMFVMPVAADEPFETTTFFNPNGLRVTVDFYEADAGHEAPIIVLYHQARWSRGEYREIAPKLNAMGFHALAVDQRSGDQVNGVENETAKAAKEASLGTAFIDAIPDLQIALLVAQSKTSGPIIAWGSSYSSALALKVVAEDSGKTPIAAVLAFSPGEYFPDRELIQMAVRNLTVPTFITSSRSEANNYAAIVEAIPESTPVVTFRPDTAGKHGSSALWSTNADSEAYWAAVEGFLAPFLASQSKSPGIRLDANGLHLEPNGSMQLLERSDDLSMWQGLAVIEATASLPLFPAMDRQVFYRLSGLAAPIAADVISVTTTSTSVSVGIRSPETGCEQYADWWEILNEEGNLLYRRILAHSHVNEQPFVRTGSFALEADQIVWIRAHMNSHGYGGQAFRGSISEGFQAAELSPLFAVEVTNETPLPNRCAF